MKKALFTTMLVLLLAFSFVPSVSAANGQPLQDHARQDSRSTNLAITRARSMNTTLA